MDFIEELARQHPGQLRIVDGQSAYFPLPDGEEVEDLLQFAELVLRPVTAAP